MERARKRVPKSVDVFVAGPAFPDQNIDGTPNSPPELRKWLCGKLHSREDVGLVFGEHREVIDYAKSATYRTLADAELILAKSCDLIVIIPASPGSCAEIGAWSGIKKLCKRILILADKKFSATPSYLRDGPFKLAVNLGADLHWVDYCSSEALPIVMNRVDIELRRKNSYGR
jgi:replication-associated recombination protein RarA